MSSLASIKTYIDTNINISPLLITALIDIDVRKKMLELDHNDHPNIQGGAAGERYHLNLAQYNSIAGLDLGAFVLKAGDTMNNNASLEFSNGVQNLKIDPIGLEIFWNAPSSLNGYGSFSPSALHFDDNTAKQADFTKNGLVIQDGVFANSVTSDEINFTHVASAKDHTLKAIADAVVFSSTLAGFKGLQYAVDLSVNFGLRSVPDVDYVQNYVNSAALLLAGGEMNEGATAIFPRGSKQIQIGGSGSQIKITNLPGTQYTNLTSDSLFLYQQSIGDLSTTSINAFAVEVYNPSTLKRNTLLSSSLELETLEGTAIISWLDLKKTLDISGTDNWQGVSISGAGKKLAFGDWFNNVLPYVYVGERDDDSNQAKVYGMYGVGLFSGFNLSPRVWCNQSGQVMINTETPVAGAELTVSGDVDISGTLDVQASAAFGTFVKYKNTVTPSNPATGQANMYVKTGKLVIQYNDAGTTKYFYLQTTALANQSWIYSATAP